MEKLYKLFKIQCYDLLCILEMEKNGIVFNTEKAMSYAKELETKQQALLRSFYDILGSDIPSITSNDDLSAILYGGVITQTIRIPIGHYKSGAKTGEIRYKIEEIKHEYSRIISPLDKTETKKSQTRIDKGEETEHTIWEVNETVLKSLKAKGKAKELLTIILEYSKLEKLRGTYLEGYTKLIEEQCWEHNMLHGTLNQCVAVTGRLSSSKPNLQNADKATKQFMETRYDNPGGCKRS